MSHRDSAIPKVEARYQRIEREGRFREKKLEI
jgi:hypothetical protein